jgi:hypothetical protein
LDNLALPNVIICKESKLLITQTLKDKIEDIVDSIQSEYRQTNGLILSEDDLKCLIYSKLRFYYCLKTYSTWRQQRRQQNINPPCLNWRIETLDQGIYANPVHTEIPWYDEQSKLAIRPDITILEPNKLSILPGLDGPNLPSKQFQFGGQGIIFELKFIRDIGGIGLKNLADIKKDFNKIDRLFRKLQRQYQSNDLFCYFVIFSKTNYKCREFDEFLLEHREGQYYKLIYKTGNVNF